MKLILFSLLLGLAGCASINSVSLTPIPAGRSNVVTARVEKFIILGFNFDNDYVNPLVEELKKKCPNGVVSGILTKDEVIHYFLAHNHIVTATGFCNRGNVASESAPAGRAAKGKRGAASVSDEPEIN